MCYVLASGSGGISEVLDINVNVQIPLKDTSSKEVARVIGNFRLKKKYLVYLRVIFTFLSPDAVLVGIHHVKNIPPRHVNSQRFVTLPTPSCAWFHISRPPPFAARPPTVPIRSEQVRLVAPMVESSARLTSSGFFFPATRHCHPRYASHFSHLRPRAADAGRRRWSETGNRS